MKTYMIRTCSADMTSYGQFTWPESGPVECPDWYPKPECGNGLHGLLLGCGEGSLLDWAEDARWLVVEVEKEDIVDLGGKIKVPKGTVVFCGTREEAIAKLEALAPECLLMPVVRTTRTAGDNGTATAGFKGAAIAGIDGSAIAGDNGTATAGYRGTAMAGAWGTATVGHYGIATAEKYGKATAGKYGTAMARHLGTAIAGDGGSATAGHSGTAIAGYGGTATAGRQGSATAGIKGTATAGEDGRAQAGERGRLLLDWWDTKTLMMRTVTGYVGEDGIEPNKPYRVDTVTGILVLAE